MCSPPDFLPPSISLNLDIGATAALIICVHDYLGTVVATGNARDLPVLQTVCEKLESGQKPFAFSADEVIVIFAAMDGLEHDRRGRGFLGILKRVVDSIFEASQH